MKCFWCGVLVLLAAGQCVGADKKDPNDPKELLQAKWNAVVKILLSQDLDDKARQKTIDKIVTPIFDFPLMARLALGKTHWSKMTDPQRDRFTALFVERLKDSYRARVSLYRDQKTQFKPAVKKGNTVTVPMEMVSDDDKMEVLYKLRLVDVPRKVKVGERWQVKVEKLWKIYDVQIQGVSILLTYRSQFDDILRNGKVEDLLARLAEPLPQPQ